MENASIVKDMALLLLGVAVGGLPWLLDKVGIEMPKPLASALLYASVFIVIWALIKLEWFKRIPFIEEKSISLSTALLLGFGLASITALWFRQKPTFYFDPDAKFEQIVRRTFVNEIVEFDGKEYSDCVFKNVTIKYNGTTTLKVHNNQFSSIPIFTTDNPAVFGTVATLKGLGYLRLDVPLVEGPERKSTGVSAPIQK